MSRIHLPLAYSKLDNNARNQIWKNLFDKLKVDRKKGGLQIEYDYDATRYVKTEEVNSLEWNGREIRNGTFTALVWARSDIVLM